MDDLIYRVGRRDTIVKTQSHIIECNAHCPNCGYGPMNGCTYMDVAEQGEHTQDEMTPKPGNFTICIRCGEYAVYEESDKSLTLRKATKKEIEKASSAIDPEQLRVYTIFQDKIKESYRRANT